MILQLNKYSCWQDTFLIHIIHLACAQISHCLLLQETLTERMHRRNKFLQMQNLKQQRMVHQKEQMQETPSWVDLEHLKQMNTQCQKRLQKFQAQLLNQRMLVRKGRQSLNVYKVQIQNTGCYFLGGSLLYLPHLGKKKKVVFDFATAHGSQLWSWRTLCPTHLSVFLVSCTPDSANQPFLR